MSSHRLSPSRRPARRARPVAWIIALLVGAACVPSSGSDDGASGGASSSAVTTPTEVGDPLPIELVGRYSSGAVMLELFADGRYAADVVNSVDGCLTVVGNGRSRGRWMQEGQGLTFAAVTDDSELLLDFDDAWVAFVGDELRLQSPGRDQPLHPVAPDSHANGLFGLFSKGH